MKLFISYVFIFALFLAPLSGSAATSAPTDVATLQKLVLQLQTLLAQLEALQKQKAIAPFTKDGLLLQYGQPIKGPSYTGAGFTENQFVLVVDVTAHNKLQTKNLLNVANFTLTDSTGREFDQLKQSSVGGQPRFRNNLVAPTALRTALMNKELGKGQRATGALEFYVPVHVCAAARTDATIHCQWQKAGHL